jgi:Set1/Ash2 histone methyltransferase complex subunit ASH2
LLSCSGVNRGSWYFEAKIIDHPEGGATRIGFGQSQANLQGPLGYDKFGYSWRSRYGTAFHTARGKTFSQGGYKLGDVIGLLIVLPELSKKSSVPDSFKDKVIVK